MRGRLEIVIVLVALGFVAFILALVRRRQLREKYALLWLGVGAMAVLLSVARPLLDRLSLVLGIAYAPSTLFLFSTIFLMAVAAHLSWEVSRLEDKTRRLAEEIALLRPLAPKDQTAGEPGDGEWGGCPESMTPPLEIDVRGDVRPEPGRERRRTL